MVHKLRHEGSHARGITKGEKEKKNSTNPFWAGLIFFRQGHFYVGAGVLCLPNAEVIVDNGVLRTAADAGLSRIWVEIYSGGKMGGRVEKLERCWRA